MDDNDHRVIGRKLDLFHFQEEGRGMAFWHPRGLALWRVIEDMVRGRMRALGYMEVRSPQILDRALWERSGHWEAFRENMFVVEDDGRSLAVKPMNCPGHIEIFRSRLRSWRELPFRLNEFGACHRNEPSGALMGLFRMRSFVQDDAHVFCREEQVEGEVRRYIGLLRSLYADLGFPSFGIALSLRPEKRFGEEPLWDRAEDMLLSAARAEGLEPVIQPGEGAFYGPKLEFSLADSMGRVWQCGTIQLDFVLPSRMGAEYVDEDDQRAAPVLIHHAVLGSLERFIGILLEHHRGRLPVALAPEQVAVLPVGEAQHGYAAEVAAELERSGVRVALLDGAGSLSRRIVDAREAGFPVLAVVGAREAEARSVALRFGEGRPEPVPLGEAAARILRLEAANEAFAA